MKKTIAKHNLGESIKFKDSYWGMMSGTIDMIGTQGNQVVYGVRLANGGSSICKENQIRK